MKLVAVLTRERMRRLHNGRLRGTLARDNGWLVVQNPDRRRARMNGGVRRWTHGPSFEEDGVRFRLWAPAQKRLALALESRGAAIPMERRDGDFFEVFVERIVAGDLYRFQLSDGTRVPDPASRFQP